MKDTEAEGAHTEAGRRYLASSKRGSVTQADVVAALNRTYPISVMRSESISSLRQWADGRTVKA